MRVLAVAGRCAIGVAANRLPGSPLAMAARSCAGQGTDSVAAGISLQGGTGFQFVDRQRVEFDVGP
jgi:hypothetical protein